MEIILLDPAQKEQYRQKIITMCENSDKEFIPPLSARGSTTQSDLLCAGGNGIEAYVAGIMAQPVLACVEEDNLLGFVSFKENYTPEHYPEAVTPNIYISTLILAPEARGRGLTKTLYRHLFYEKFPERTIYTRTWSKNIAHITILNRFGFEEILRIPNHRGEGIDTAYYELKK